MKIKIKEISSRYVDYLPFYGVLVCFTAILNILDTFLTALMVGYGQAIEMNPIMDLLLDLGVGYFVAFKLAIGAIIFPIWWKIMLKYGPEAAKWPVWICFSFYYLVVVNNFIAALMMGYDAFL